MKKHSRNEYRRSYASRKINQRRNDEPIRNGKSQITRTCANPYNAMKPKDRVRMARFIGRMYREARSLVELSEVNPDMWPETLEVKHSRSLIRFIDLAVAACTKEHALILRRVFLEGDESEWYLEYYTLTRYLRIMKQALEEFYSFLGKPSPFYDNIHP